MSKPKVIIFNGLSLDGRMDFGSGAIDMGLYYELASRWNADAMLSGSETMLAAEAPATETNQIHIHPQRISTPWQFPGW